MPRPQDSNWSAPRPRTPAPQIDPVFLWPTPDKRDLLFYVEKAGDLPANKVWNYGDAYTDRIKYPNHKLVFVSPETPDSWSKWYYASNRIEEDEYNWTFADADIGGTKFKAVTREYIIPRADWERATPAMGATMANVPKDKFTETFVLAERQQIQVQDEVLTSLYVFERRTYVKKVPFFDVEINRESGTAYAVVTTLYYRGEVVTGSSTIEALVAAPTNAYWKLDANGFGNTAQQLSENWWAVTNRQLVDPSTIYEWDKNRLGPNRYYCPKGTISTTVITTNNTVGEISPLPTVNDGERVQILKWGSIQKVTTTSQTGSPQTLNGLDLLPDDGITYPKTDELVTQAQVPSSPSGVDGSGVVIEYESIDGCHASKVTRQAVSQEQEILKSAQKLYPERYIPDKGVSTNVATTSGALDVPDQPTAVLGAQISVDQKGRIRKETTTSQVSAPVPLKGIDFMPDDGNLYPSRDEVIPLADVPETTSIVNGAGEIEEYVPIDANFASKRTRKAVSTEQAQRYTADRFAPEEFLPDGGKVYRTVETLPGVTDPATAPTGVDQARITVEQKGAIRTTETLTQTTTPVPLQGTNFDERTGEGFLETREVVPAASVVPTNVDSEGNMVVYQPRDTHWAIKNTRKIASVEERNWQDIINYEWPPVLQEITYKTFQRRNGTQIIVPIIKYKKGYSGPQVVSVRQYWSLTPVTPIPPVQMIPEGFRYQNPYFTVGVEPCLHGSITFTTTIGTTDPIWLPASDTETFAATNLTDWPESIVWVESKPFRGGYVVTEYTLNKPA